MNSYIISAVSGFGKKLCNFFRHSFIYRTVDKIYQKASASWKKRVIIGKIKAAEYKGAQTKSCIYKIVHFPFTFFEKISENAGECISCAVQKSFILNALFSFLNSALSLNTKFYAAFLISAVILRTAAALSVSYLLFAAAVFGILLFFTDYNVTDFFAESKAVRFLLSFVGFSDISFNIYERERIKKPLSLFLAVAVGAVSGILSLKSPVFALLPFFILFGAALLLRHPICGIFLSVFAAPFIPTMLWRLWFYIRHFALYLRHCKKGILNGMLTAWEQDSAYF